MRISICARAQSSKAGVSYQLWRSDPGSPVQAMAPFQMDVLNKLLKRQMEIADRNRTSCCLVKDNTCNTFPPPLPERMFPGSRTWLRVTNALLTLAVSSFQIRRADHGADTAHSLLLCWFNSDFTFWFMGFTVHSLQTKLPNLCF